MLEYGIAGAFFMGILMLVCTGLYFVLSDIPGAIKETRTEEARRYLSSAKARRQAASVVKQFQQSTKQPIKGKKKGKKEKSDTDDVPYLDANVAGDFSDLLFPESAERWPRRRVLRVYSKEQKDILNDLFEKSKMLESANGICILAGGDRIEFKQL